MVKTSSIFFSSELKRVKLRIIVLKFLIYLIRIVNFALIYIGLVFYLKFIDRDVVVSVEIVSICSEHSD